MWRGVLLASALMVLAAVLSFGAAVHAERLRAMEERMTTLETVRIMAPEPTPSPRRTIIYPTQFEGPFYDLMRPLD